MTGLVKLQIRRSLLQNAEKRWQGSCVLKCTIASLHHPAFSVEQGKRLLPIRESLTEWLDSIPQPRTAEEVRIVEEDKVSLKSLQVVSTTGNGGVVIEVLLHSERVDLLRIILTVFDVVDSNIAFKTL